MSNPSDRTWSIWYFVPHLILWKYHINIIYLNYWLYFTPCCTRTKVENNRISLFIFKNFLAFFWIHFSHVSVSIYFTYAKHTCRDKKRIEDNDHCGVCLKKTPTYSAVSSFFIIWMSFKIFFTNLQELTKCLIIPKFRSSIQLSPDLQL